MLERRSALDELADAPARDGDGPSLHELPVAAAALVFGRDQGDAGWPGSAVAALALGGADDRLCGDGASLLVPVAPGRWLAVTASPGRAVEFRRLVPPECRIDLDSARTWLRVAGAGADLILGRELPIDLRARVFPAGSSAQTTAGQVDIVIHALDRGSEPAFDLLVGRSHALHFVTHLVDAGGIGFRRAVAVDESQLR